MGMKYANGTSIGDGLRLVRVSNGGTKFFLMTDQKTEHFSEVFFSADALPPPPPINTPPTAIDGSVTIDIGAKP